MINETNFNYRALILTQGVDIEDEDSFAVELEVVHE